MHGFRCNLIRMTIGELFDLELWAQRVYNRLWLRYMEFKSELWRGNVLNIRGE